MNKKTNRPEKVSKKQMKQKKQKRQPDKGETFRNVCVGLGAIGTVILSYIQYFM